MLLQVFDKIKKWKLRQIVGCQKSVVKERQDEKSSSKQRVQIFVVEKKQKYLVKWMEVKIVAILV